ncbi:MAG: GNAT family N-acetyltransferase [Lachnospiraceae bacterium]|nr:GNAT family N-acetyltransferase [Lachnospiraceae bacterium]
MQERVEIFRRNFPYIVRDDGAVRRILSHPENRYIERRREDGTLVGLSVVNRNVILLLCVDEACRQQGLGTQLLEESERIIREAGYATCSVGVGFDYLMPGVPTSKHYFPVQNIRLYEGLDSGASYFFEKRGYRHSWEDGDCFDMQFPMKDLEETPHQIGDTIEGITYRFAVPADREGILQCTDDACEEFSSYYADEGLYEPESRERVLIAVKEQEVCGALMVGPESDIRDLGSIGCTAVKKAWQGRHIATRLVLLGTKALKEMGMKEAFLSYTYSGLDRLYGAAGFRIKVFYMMAEKRL